MKSDAIRCCVIGVIASLMLIGPPSLSRADSIFSINGLGEVSYPVHGQARGMGGVNIAQLDGRRISLVNPATIGAIDTTTLTAVFLFEQRKLKDDIGSTTILGWGPRLINLVIPISHGIVLGGGLSPFSDANFHLSAASEDLGSSFQSAEPYLLNISAEGGTHLGSIAAAKNVGDKLYIGASASFLFGSTKEEWIRDFSNSLCLDTDDLCETTYFGRMYSAGIALRPHPRLALGTVYSWSEGIKAEIERSTTTDTFAIEKKDVDFPPSLGIGMQYRFSRLTAGADVLIRYWDKFRRDGIHIPRHDEAMRFSLGLELAPSPDRMTSFYKRMPWRIGFYREPGYYLDTSGERVNETCLTCGTSLFFKEQRGAVDLSFEMGKKGTIADNGAEEWVFRQSISIVGWERWFERGTR